MIRFILAALLLSLSPIMAEPDTPASIAKQIVAPLIKQTNINTLQGKCAANGRLRQIQLALKWHALKLLSDEGLQAVEKAELGN